MSKQTVENVLPQVPADCDGDHLERRKAKANLRYLRAQILLAVVNYEIQLASITDDSSGSDADL